MAELVDALDSKSGYRKVVQVRFLFWAQKQLHSVIAFLFASILLLKYSITNSTHCGPGDGQW